jgi:hypothetical protein
MKAELTLQFFAKLSNIIFNKNHCVIMTETL